MTVCAIVTILAKKGIVDFSEIEFIVGLILFGIVGPGLVLFNRWPIYVRWMLPLFAGLAVTVATMCINGSESDFYAYAFVYGVSAAVYSLWGIAIGIDAQRRTQQVIDDQTSG
jgi:hypothetical protein